jgi:hypothetical protein
VALLGSVVALVFLPSRAKAEIEPSVEDDVDVDEAGFEVARA